MADLQSLKEKGNECFKNGQYTEALQYYTQALDLGQSKDADKAIIYKNRAACELKLNNHESAIKDATKSLDLVENDPKALYRRCQAYDALGRVEEAYKDAMTLIKIDPKNKAAQAIYERLNPIVQEKMKERNSTSSKVSQMFNLAFDSAVEKEKRLPALNNLIVLTREGAGAELIFQSGGIERLIACLKEIDTEIRITALRVLASLAKSSKNMAAAVVGAVDVPQLMLLLGQGSGEMPLAVAHLIQTLFNVYCGLDDFTAAIKQYEEGRKKGDRPRYPQHKMDDAQQLFVDTVFPLLIKMFDSSKVTPDTRDCAMELVMKNITWRKGLGWTQKFLDTNGIDGLLTVAGTQPQYKTLAVTDQSHMHASVALNTIYEDLVSDKQRDCFKDKCTDFLKYLFGDGVLESKIEAIECLSSLLQGPFEVGSILLGTQGVVELMLTLANSDNPHYQRVAVEAIVHSASKKNRCTGILKDAVPILKKLYQSSDESIKVRALVGLCKLGSFAGGDVSQMPMADGSTQKLARICRKFLVNTARDHDLRKWATEGLAYLTLDADVKEELVDDTGALKSIFELSRNTEKNMTYACVTVLVNVINSYDKPDIMPEMVELAKFSKQHVPEEHEKDKHDFVIKRIHKLAQAGVTNALVALSNSESKNCRELLCRVYLALATEEKLRGLMVQQGAVKSLLQLIENNTDNGTVLAAHCLAKIAVTMDPATAFPGQRIFEVVRPLISLLHSDRSSLQNFEALLALTNLSSTNDDVRKRMLTDNGLMAIEHMMFEPHEMIRRAATECMCNMLMCEKVQERFEGENDRVKMMVLFAGEDDVVLARAAAGGMAMMSSNPKLCEKMTKVKPWLDIVQMILVSDSTEIQHRAVHLTMNLMSASKEIATQLIESQALEILMGITRLEGPEREQIRQCAQSALDTAVAHGLIKPYQGEHGVGELFQRGPGLELRHVLKIPEETEEEEEGAKTENGTKEGESEGKEKKEEEDEEESAETENGQEMKRRESDDREDEDDEKEFSQTESEDRLSGIQDSTNETQENTSSPEKIKGEQKTQAEAQNDNASSTPSTHSNDDSKGGEES